MLTAAGLVLAAAACVSAPPPPPRAAAAPAAPGAQPADTAPAPRTWTAAATPDSIAQWAISGCRWALANEIGCYERALLTVLRQVGVEKAMAALDRIAARDGDASREGHVLAHGIGIAAYTTPATVSQTFARCSPAWQSGCYHGVIQAYFADGRTGGVTGESLNALCSGYRTADKAWIQFHCAHGIGHGLMAVRQHHLLKALEGCDLLEPLAERESCYGGAFMENVVNATRPHHVSTTRTGGDEHAGHPGAPAPAPAPAPAGSAVADGHDHDHFVEEAASAEPPFKALDRSEPLYPCTIVAERHRFACYLMQTSPILYNNGGDFAAAARQCERAPASMVPVCFMSLGRDAAAYSGRDDRKGVRLCSQAPEARVPACIIGLAKNRVDVTADAADGFTFCRVVPAGAAKTACYQAVGAQVSVLVAAPAARERACACAERGFVAACRTGAGLPPEPQPAS